MSLAKKKFAILILAAGSSSRMGQPKQLLPWKNTNLLGNALQEAKFSDADEIYLVLGAHSDLIRGSLELQSIKIVENKAWQSGMGSSISIGVKRLLAAQTDWDGILIALGDQPLVDSGFLNELIDRFKSANAGIVATNYKQKPGVPAVFGKKYFHSLSQLEAKQGAKQLITQNKGDCLLIDPGNRTLDIDTPEDYKSIRNP